MTSELREIEGEAFEVDFPSDGGSCRAWHLPPRSDELSGERGAPCVVMAHGFGGVREARLGAYAERFTAAGMHALVFDYRHFGSSPGEPRQLLSIPRQLRDWTSAVAFARTLEQVDPERIALWGTSFAGGHVLKTAADDGRVAAVVSQCPFVDGPRTLLNLMRYAGPGQLMRMTAAGLRDLARAATGREPHRLPVVGPPDTLAAMTSPDAEPGFLRIAPPGWRNEVCARVSLTIGSYRPGASAPRLSCPLLVQICEADAVAPAEAAEHMAARAGGPCEVRRYPIGHFDIYVGDDFERAVTDQVDFLTRSLAGLPAGERAAASPAG